MLFLCRAFLVFCGNSRAVDLDFHTVFHGCVGHGDDQVVLGKAGCDLHIEIAAKTYLDRLPCQSAVHDFEDVKRTVGGAGRAVASVGSNVQGRPTCTRVLEIMRRSAKALAAIASARQLAVSARGRSSMSRQLTLNNRVAVSLR